MGQEIDLLVNYPRTKRNVEERGAEKTEDDRKIARQFGKEFFDGDRRNGYGGFSYFPRFWQPVIPTFQSHFNLTNESSLLDVGCAKGFMLHDMNILIPGMELKGIDVSSYAIEHAIDDMKPNVQVADAKDLPYEDDSFDVVVAINTIHNLEEAECAQALREIERVSKKGSYVTVDAYYSEEEKERMFAWNLTAKTIMHADEWKQFFANNGYTRYCYWCRP